MDKGALAAALEQHHQAFLARLRELGEAAMTASLNNKWTPAQQMEHIRLSTAPVAFALLVPKWLLVRRFGLPNRPGRTYEGLVQRYKEKLAAGGRASGGFVPAHVPIDRVAAAA